MKNSPIKIFLILLFLAPVLIQADPLPTPTPCHNSVTHVPLNVTGVAPSNACDPSANQDFAIGTNPTNNSIAGILQLKGGSPYFSGPGFSSTPVFTLTPTSSDVPCISGAIIANTSTIENDSGVVVDSYSSTVGAYGGSNVYNGGNEQAATQIIINAPAVVHGQLLPNDPPLLSLFPTPGAFTDLNEVNLTSPGQTLTLAPGDYIVDNLQMDSSSQLILSGTGRVRIWFNHLNIGGSSTLGDPANPGRLWLFSRSTSTPVTLDGAGSKLYGVLFAPNVTVNVAGSGQFFGALVGSNLLLNGVAVGVHYDQALGEGCRGPAGSENRPTDSLLHAIGSACCSNATHTWVLGDNMLVYSNDGSNAALWNSYDLAQLPGIPATTQLYGISVSNCDDVWAVGSDGLILHRVAGQSPDVVGNWTLVNQENGIANLNAVKRIPAGFFGAGCPSSDWLLVAGAALPGQSNQIHLLKNINGSPSFTTETLPASISSSIVFNALTVLSDGTVYAVGSNGSVLQGQVNGACSDFSWNKIDVGSSANLESIAAYSPTQITIGGSNNQVISFDGSQWDPFSLGVNMDWTAVIYDANGNPVAFCEQDVVTIICPQTTTTPTPTKTPTLANSATPTPSATPSNTPASPTPTPTQTPAPASATPTFSPTAADSDSPTLSPTPPNGLLTATASPSPDGGGSGDNGGGTGNGGNGGNGNGGGGGGAAYCGGCLGVNGFGIGYAVEVGFGGRLSGGPGFGDYGAIVCQDCAAEVGFWSVGGLGLVEHYYQGSMMAFDLGTRDKVVSIQAPTSSVVVIETQNGSVFIGTAVNDSCTDYVFTPQPSLPAGLTLAHILENSSQTFLYAVGANASGNGVLLQAPISAGPTPSVGAWSDISSLLPAGSPGINGIIQSSINEFWIVGNSGELLHSSNFPGAGFSQAISPSTPLQIQAGASLVSQPVSSISFKAIAAVSPTELWAVGTQGVILHTLDGGATWAQIGVGVTTYNLNALEVLGASNIAFVGDFGTVLQWNGSQIVVQNLEFGANNLTGICEGFICGLGGFIASIDTAFPTPTISPTFSQTETWTNSPTATPSASPTLTATPSSTQTNTDTDTPTATPSSTQTSTDTNTPTATPSATETVSSTSSPTASPSPSVTPSSTLTLTATPTPSPLPTACSFPDTSFTVQGIANCTDQKQGPILTNAVVLGPLPAGCYVLSLTGGCLYYGNTAVGPLNGTGLRFALDDNAAGTHISSNVYDPAWMRIGYGSYSSTHNLTMTCATAQAIGFSSPYNPQHLQQSITTLGGRYLFIEVDDEYSYVCGDNSGFMTGKLQCAPCVSSVTAPAPGAAAFRVAASQNGVVGQPLVVSSGQPFDLGVAAVDGSGVTQTSYTGTAIFSEQPDAANSLPSPAVFAAADRGVRFFGQQASIQNPGLYQVAVVDQFDPSRSGLSNQIQVVAITPSVTPPASATLSATVSQTYTTTPSTSGTQSPSQTATLSFSPSDTPTPSRTATLSASPTGSFTQSPTPTRSNTSSPSATSSPSRTPSPTPTRSFSASPSFTRTPTASPSPTPLPTLCSPSLPQFVSAAMIAHGCIGGGPNFSFAYNVSSGSNQLLILRVENSSSPNGGTLSNVKYGGVSMTLQSSASASNLPSNPDYLLTYYLASPPSGAQNFSFSNASGNCSWNIAAELYSNVDQTRPLGTYNALQSGTSNASSLDSVVINTGGPASLVSVYMASDQADADVPTSGSGQHSLALSTGAMACCEGVYGDYDAVGAAGAYTLTYNVHQAGRPYAAQAIEIRGNCSTSAATATATRSPTPLPSATRTPSRTATPSASPSATFGPSRTMTGTFSATPSATGSFTQGPSATVTQTFSSTPTASQSPTPGPCSFPVTTFTVDGLANCVDPPALSPSRAVVIGPLAAGCYTMTLVSGCIFYGIDVNAPLYGTSLRYALDDNPAGTNLSTTTFMDGADWMRIGFASFATTGFVSYTCEQASAIGYAAPYNPVTVTSSGGQYLFVETDDTYQRVCGDNTGFQVVRLECGACEQAMDFKRLALPSPVTTHPAVLTPGIKPPALISSSKGGGPTNWLPAGKQLMAMPNPAGNAATAAFKLSQGGLARLSLFDFSGNRVWSEDLGEVGSGELHAPMSLQSLPMGIYFLVLSADHGSGFSPVANFKMAVVK